MKTLFPRLILVLFIAFGTNACRYYKIGQVVDINSEYLNDKAKSDEYLIVHLDW